MRKSGKFLIYIIPIIVAIFNVLIILFPKEIITASKDGLNLWFNTVLPSLLPFIIGTNLLIGLGFISFLGTLLEPLMIKLFNVPGCGAFAWILGMTSGYPIGAKITSDLRKSKQITKSEAQRLLSFSNNSGPLFILGSVATGMFKNVSAGYLIMLAHYLGSIATGIIFRYYKYNEKNNVNYYNNNLFKKALINLKTSRMKDGRSFGALLGDSVKNAMETVVVIGGFIILFSVLVKSMEITNILDLFKNILQPIGITFGIETDMYDGILVGIIEITNGCKIFSTSTISIAKIIAAAGIISWGGFSIHAQSISFISKTDIKISIYLFSKLLHSIFSIIFAILLCPFFDIKSTNDILQPTFNNNIIKTFASSSFKFLIIVTLIFIVGLVLNLFKANTKNDILK